MPTRIHLLLLSSMACFAATLVAAPCNTPPILSPEAVTIDVGKYRIVDVLAHASDPDGHALTLSLAGDTCPSQVSALVTPAQALRISASALSPSCQVTYRVADGAGGISTSHVTVSVIDPHHIFSDGFELGSTAAWSQAQP